MLYQAQVREMSDKELIEAARRENEIDHSYPCGEVIDRFERLLEEHAALKHTYAISTHDGK